MYDIDALVQKLIALSGSQVHVSEDKRTMYADKHDVVKLMDSLKHPLEFIMLTDITAADYPDRYEIIYHVTNYEAELLQVKTRLDKNDTSIPSIVSVWKAADVMEREVYDLFGIIFEGHGNLKRILCKDDFEGHPLRKDYKLDIADRFQQTTRG